MKQAIAVCLRLAAFLAIPALAGNSTVVAVVAKKPVDCVAIVDAAALQAMNGTGQVGQMSVYGDPVSMGPGHLRVDVHVFDVLYAVDVIIDQSCRVLSVSTDRETNPPP